MLPSEVKSRQDPAELKVDLVLDTNVIMEIVAIVDLWKAAMGRRPGEPDLQRRRVRAAESLLFAMHLHEAALTTKSLRHEFPRVFNAHPAPFDAKAVSGVLEHFVKNWLLTNWKSIDHLTADIDSKGTVNDTLLLRWAQADGVPLITRDAKLKRRAGTRGLDPAEYLRGKFDREKIIADFFQRFDRRQLGFVIAYANAPIGRHQSAGYRGRKMSRDIEAARQYLRWVLDPILSLRSLLSSDMRQALR